MPIYYQKVSQNDDENMNYINYLEKKSEKAEKSKFLNRSKANSYYELSEFDSTSTNSILSIDKIYLEENIELEKIETRYGSVIVGKQTYANGQPMARASNGHPNNGGGKQANDNDANSQGERPRVKLNSIILTVHDIGLNHESNFLQLFSNSDAKVLLKNFTIYHLNLPGQHTSSEQIESIYSYPTIDQLSEIIDFVVSYYHIRK